MKVLFLVEFCECISEKWWEYLVDVFLLFVVEMDFFLVFVIIEVL